MRGGDETDAPAEGWLVVACFHTLWSSASVKIMPALNEVVPMFQDSVSFLSIRADGQGMAPISKALKVTKFPTIIVLRGGNELTRIEGQERVVEQVLRAINGNLTAEDKMARIKHRHRIRMEKALALGQTDIPDEPEEKGQIEW